MHFIVFDVDGTLVDSAAFDARLCVQAVRTVLGVEVDDDWSQSRHVTDSGILNEILENADRNTNCSLEYAQVEEVFVRMTADYVEDQGGQLSEIAGARAFVDTLSSHPEASVALATGGWRETATMKLRAIGLDPKELCLALASDAVSRVEIMRIAEQRALLGKRATRRTYFGDGPWDKQASQESGYDFIAIGNNVASPIRYPDSRDYESIFEELELGF